MRLKRKAPILGLKQVVVYLSSTFFSFRKVITNVMAFSIATRFGCFVIGALSFPIFLMALSMVIGVLRIAEWVIRKLLWLPLIGF